MGTVAGDRADLEGDSDPAGRGVAEGAAIAVMAAVLTAMEAAEAEAAMEASEAAMEAAAEAVVARTGPREAVAAGALRLRRRLVPLAAGAGVPSFAASPGCAGERLPSPRQPTAAAASGRKLPAAESVQTVH